MLCLSVCQYGPFVRHQFDLSAALCSCAVVVCMPTPCRHQPAAGCGLLSRCPFWLPAADRFPARKLLPRLPFLATMVCCLVHACLSSFIIYRRQVAVWVCAALFAFFLSLLLVLQLIISCCLRRSALLAALLVSGNIISPTRH